MAYEFLSDLSIILIVTKALGLFTQKIRMPQVVGALAAGLFLGPIALGIIHESDFIKNMAELGVIVLMFSAGMETDLNELKKCGKTSFIIALLGVIVPLGAGFSIAAFFNNGGTIGQINSKMLLENIFVGIVLTATSVSITVETLREMGKLNNKAGTAILVAAIIDDILGIIALTVITSAADPAINIGVTMLKILGFFVFSIIVGIVFFHLFNAYSKRHSEKRRYPIIAFSFCLAMSFIAEHFFGVADITGAFIAGVVISNTMHKHYIFHRFEITSYMLLTPIFFASIGISIKIDKMSPQIILCAILLTIAAILSKIIGCGLGAMVSGFSKQESLQIGVGMISRGEVALIVATKGASVGIFNPIFMAPLIIVIITTTLITPLLLKLVYREKQITA